MTFVPAPGIVQIAPIFDLKGQRCENVYHYRVGGTIDRAKLQAMAITYLTWFVAHNNLFSDSLGLQLIYCRDLSTANSQTFDFVPTGTTDGSRTSPTLPNNCTLAVKRETGFAGRSRRGRLYWTGITEDMLSDSNSLLQATAAALAAAQNTLLAAQIADNAAQEVVLHRKLGTGSDVVEYTVTDFVIDSQRRRLPGHNRHH